MTEMLNRADVIELRNETSAIVTAAASFKIATNVSYQLAAEELLRIKGVQKRLESVRKAITQPMDAAKKAVLDFFRNPEEELQTAERQIKNAMGAYRARLEQEETEKRRLAEEVANQERERIALAAAQAASEGRREEAQEIASSVVSIAPAPVIARQAPKVHGIVTKDVWKFEITDATLIPREYLVVDETAIRKVVQATKGKVVIAGVRMWCEEQDSVNPKAARF